MLKNIYICNMSNKRKFKKGDIVTCVRGYEDKLTYGNSYTILGVYSYNHLGEYFVDIRDEEGVLTGFFKNTRFVYDYKTSRDNVIDDILR